MRRQTEKPAAGAIDFHAHILPGVDHGSVSPATSLLQMALMREAGIAAVVATSHFYAHRESSVEAFLTRRNAAAATLAAALPPESPTLCLGAEVLVCVGLQHMPGLGGLAVAGTDVILLEMPFGPWGHELLGTVEGIVARGLIPLMAHIDRYPAANLERLFELSGLAYQVNAEGLCRLTTRGALLRMADIGAVAAVGSDLHGAAPRDYRRFERALSLLGEARCRDIAAHSRALLSGALPPTENG